MNNQKIGQFIAQNRRKKGLTQLQLAEQLHVTNKAVSKWENGRCLPDPALFAPLCDTLGITLNELLAGEKISKEEREQYFEQNIQALGAEYQKKISHRRSVTIAFLAAALAILVGILASIGLLASLLYPPGFSTINGLNTQWHLNLTTQLKKEYSYREGFEDTTALYVFDDPEETIREQFLNGGSRDKFEEEISQELHSMAVWGADTSYFPDFSHPYWFECRTVGDTFPDRLYCLYDTQLKKLYLIEIIR